VNDDEATAVDAGIAEGLSPVGQGIAGRAAEADRRAWAGGCVARGIVGEDA
jgi:hypothetical protein